MENRRVSLHDSFECAKTYYGRYINLSPLDPIRRNTAIPQFFYHTTWNYVYQRDREIPGETSILPSSLADSLRKEARRNAGESRADEFFQRLGTHIGSIAGGPGPVYTSLATVSSIIQSFFPRRVRRRYVTRRRVTRQAAASERASPEGASSVRVRGPAIDESERKGRKGWRR